MPARTVSAMLAGVAGAFAVAGLWEWVAFFAAFGLLLGGAELLCVRWTDETLSARFWRYRKRYPRRALALAGALVLAVGVIVAHLLG